MIENAGFNPARQFTKALWDYRSLWLIPLAACTILSVLFALFGPKTYSARQTLVIRDDLAGTAFKPGRFESLESLKSAQETILEIARRPLVVRRTLQKLGPASGRASKSWPDDQVIEETQGKININAPNGAELGKTEAIVLSVTAASKQRASKFIEILMDEIEKNSREFRALRFQSMEEELQQAATVAKRSYEQSANQLQTFEKQFSTDLGTLRSLNDSLSSKNALVDSLAEMKRESREAQVQVARVEKQMDVLRQAQSDPTVLLSAPPQELLDLQPTLGGLTKGLNDALLRLSTNLGKYTRDHPTVMSDKREIAGIKNQIISELASSFNSLNSQYSLRLQTFENLKQRIKDGELRLTNLSGNRVSYNKLTDDVMKKQEALGNAESQLSEIQSLGAAAHTVNLLTRIDKPQISYNPIGPTKKTIVFGGMLAGLLMGMGLVMFFAPIDIGESLPSNRRQLREMATASGAPAPVQPTAFAATGTAPPPAPPVNQDHAPPAQATPDVQPVSNTEPAQSSEAIFNSSFRNPNTAVATTEQTANQFAQALAKSIADIAASSAKAQQNQELQQTQVQPSSQMAADAYAAGSTNEAAPAAPTTVVSPASIQTTEAIVDQTIASNFSDVNDMFDTASASNALSAPETTEQPEAPEQDIASTSSVFDKLINQLDSAKSTGAKLGSTQETQLEPEEIQPEASDNTEIENLAEAVSTDVETVEKETFEDETVEKQEPSVGLSSVSMDSILPDPVNTDPVSFETLPEAAEATDATDFVESKSGLAAQEDTIFTALESLEPTSETLDYQNSSELENTEPEDTEPEETKLKELLGNSAEEKLADPFSQMTDEEARKLKKSSADPVSDEMLEKNLEALLGDSSAVPQLGASRDISTAPDNANAATDNANASIDNAWPDNFAAQDNVREREDSELILPNEQNIISGLGLAENDKSDEIDKALEDFKNQRQIPLTESRIVAKTDSFPLESETPNSEIDDVFAESGETPETTTPASPHQQANTVAPPGVRQTAETADPQTVSQTDKETPTIDESKADDKPKRQRAKTVDLRELKNQLSSNKNDTDSELLRGNVAETVIAFENGEDIEPEEDLSDKISRLTKSIEDYIQPDD